LRELFPNVARYYEKNWLEKKNWRWKDFIHLVKKGYFPYEYLTNPEKFDDPCLPSLAAFRSRLKDATITPDQYKVAKTMWEKFEVQVKTFKVKPKTKLFVCSARI
jgi:hypothetical protein